MHASATTNAIPAATNLTTLAIASNRRQGQWPAAGREDRRQKVAPPVRDGGRVRRTAGRVGHQAQTLQTHTRRAVARLKQRFVAAPWMAVDES